MTDTSYNPDPLSIASFDPENATAASGAVQGPGIKVGEGAVIHPTFGVETGVISNVFYTHNDPEAVGILRLLAQVAFGTADGSRLDPGAMAQGPASLEQPDVSYQASLRATYDETLSSDDTVRSASSGLGLGATLRGLTSPAARISFGFFDDYARSIRAANFETTANDTRDINNLTLSLDYHNAGSISGFGYFHNTLDVFETDPNYPNRLQNTLGVHPMWRWLPETQFYGDFSIGVDTGVGTNAASQAKATSYPLNTVLGVSTLLSLKTSVRLEAGYANGFYTAGPSYSAPSISAIASYQYSPLGLMGVSYRYLHQDSVNANFFGEHVISAYVEQGFAPFVLVAQGQVHFRDYEGLQFEGMDIPTATSRSDILVSAVGGIRYNFRNWIAATVDYRFTLDQTDFRYTDATGQRVNPSYTRHELLAGLRVAM